MAKAGGAQPYPRLVKRHSKIRLGYLSGDFREHPLGRLVAEMFEVHDRDRFEVYAYCYSQDDGSAVRQRLIQGVDHFCSIQGLSPRSAAQKIHQDEIDILIDLTGYTGHSHSEILALRPAPVQVSYLGYLATTGSDFVDYIIADAQAIPETEDQFFTEKVVRLPFFQVSDRTRKAARVPSRQALGLPQDAFIYCCFNQPYKITPELFERWMTILRRVPKSVLWLYAFHAETRKNLAAAPTAYGIDSTRIIFAQRASMEEHLARMRIADLFLDTSPYNAGATAPASDALWAGLPVLTCPGTGFASRMCASLLQAAEIPELIAHSPEAYEQMAIELAHDQQRLTTLSERLNERRQSMALFDCPRTVSNLETAFTAMLINAAQGKSPKDIDIKS